MMYYELVDKAVIWLLCMLNAAGCGVNVSFVTASLSGIFIVMLIYIDRINGYIYAAAVIAYYICIIICPVYMCFLPLVAYDQIMYIRKGYIAGTVAVYIFTIYYVVSASRHTDNYDYMPMLIVLIFTAVIYAAVILFVYNTRNLNRVIKKMELIRDEGVEKSYRLENKNNELIRQQDYEINAATFRERNRIAREIHDNVGHMLTRAILQAGALKVIVKDEAAAKQIDGLSETLNTAMDNIRISVHDLHDEAIDLKSAVGEIINGFPKLHIEYKYSIHSDVANNIKYCFIAIIKESLNNTAKHSDGDCVRILLNEHPGFYQLVVQDNGKDISDNYIGGIGLTSIRDRVRALNGNFNINTDNGFKISISIMK